MKGDFLSNNLRLFLLSFLLLTQFYGSTLSDCVVVDVLYRCLRAAGMISCVRNENVHNESSGGERAVSSQRSIIRVYSYDCFIVFTINKLTRIIRLSCALNVNSIHVQFYVSILGMPENYFCFVLSVFVRSTLWSYAT